jgi:hypothetical protein
MTVRDTSLRDKKYVQTFYQSGLPTQADVIEACNCQAAVLASVEETLLLPAHENVWIIS